MPLYAFACEQGHTQDIFCHTREDFGCRTVLCERCHSSMAPVLSMGRGLTWFEEGRARVIHNLGHEPVTITSHEQHKRIMKERGLEWAPPKRGMPGCW